MLESRESFLLRTMFGRQGEALLDCTKIIVIPGIYQFKGARESRKEENQNVVRQSPSAIR